MNAGLLIDEELLSAFSSGIGKFLSLYRALKSWSPHNSRVTHKVASTTTDDDQKSGKIWGIVRQGATSIISYRGVLGSCVDR